MRSARWPQGLEEAQVERGRTLLLEAAESEEENEGEARRLFLLAAAQGSCNAYVPRYGSGNLHSTT